MVRRVPTPVPAEDDAEAEGRRGRWAPWLGEGWFGALDAELRRPSLEETLQKVETARAAHGLAVLPPAPLVFRAFTSTPLEKVRVVIVGQDPYHGPRQAMGLAFSVPRGMSPPPSLQNMLREAGVWPSPHGDLTQWAEQGVLLLNTVLTVMQGQTLSHRNIGWERLTDAAIRAVSRECKSVVFLLWGREANEKAKLVDELRHTVLLAGHPSPLWYEKHYKGCGHFAKTNECLRARGLVEIQWRLA